jgi:hypothetical protein
VQLVVCVGLGNLLLLLRVGLWVRKLLLLLLLLHVGCCMV